jgi:hypothetical protein
MLLLNRWGVSNQTRPFLRNAAIAFDGNSIMTEDYAVGAGIPRQLQSCLSMQGITVAAQSYAVSGQTTQDMITGAAPNNGPVNPANSGSTQIDGLLKTPAYRNANARILCVFEGTNELGYKPYSSPNRVSECYKSLHDYCFLRRSAGWFVVIMGSTPRSHGYFDNIGSAASYDTDMVALDKLLEDNVTDFANLYFPTRRMVPTYQAVAPYANDPAHPTVYGCGLIASALASFLMDNLRTD